MRPTSILTPVDLIHAVDLPTGAKETWLLLRLLAGEQACTPAASPFELCQLTGKSRTTLYEHLKRLEAQGFLHTRPVGRRLVICFPALASVAGASAADAPACVPNCETPPDPVPNSVPQPPETVRQTARSLHPGRKSAPKPLEFPDSGPPIKDLKDSAPDSGGRRERAARRSSGRDDRGQPDLPPDDPVQVYRGVYGFRPTPPQRQEIYVQVSDAALWRLTLEHWQLHAWNPRNLPGLLELYGRGGPSACHACARTAARPPAPAPGRDSLSELIAERRRQDAREAYLLHHDAFSDPPEH